MRSRSGSITPAYSVDLTLLQSQYSGTKNVSFAEAKDAVTKFTIYEDPAFQRRAKLETDSDWSMFMQSCILKDAPEGTFNLEMLLKKCYTVTFAMPSSPASQLRSSRSADGAESPSALAV